MAAAPGAFVPPWRARRPLAGAPSTEQPPINTPFPLLPPLSARPSPTGTLVLRELARIKPSQRSAPPAASGRGVSDASGARSPSPRDSSATRTRSSRSGADVVVLLVWGLRVVFSFTLIVYASLCFLLFASPLVAPFLPLAALVTLAMLVQLALQYVGEWLWPLSIRGVDIAPAVLGLVLLVIRWRIAARLRRLELSCLR